MDVFGVGLIMSACQLQVEISQFTKNETRNLEFVYPHSRIRSIQRNLKVKNDFPLLPDNHLFFLFVN